MSFILLACSDIRAEKVNLEFPFSSPPPSIDVLRSVLEETFRHEEAAMKQAKGYTDTRPCEPFTISRLQRYDDDTQSWSEVSSPAQLHTYDQLYVFRKHTTKSDISVQQELPPPRRSVFSAGGQGGAAIELNNKGSAQHQPPQHYSTQCSPHHATSPFSTQERGGSARHYADSPRAGSSLAFGREMPTHRLSQTPPHNQHYSGGSHNNRFPRKLLAAAVADSRTTDRESAMMETGAAADSASPYNYYRERTTPERVEYLFRIGDQGRRGSLTFKEFESLFRLSDIRFPPEVVQDLHRHFAEYSDRDSAMSFDGFQHYAKAFPVAINIAYQRLTNQDREEALHTAQHETAREVEQMQQTVAQLESRLGAARKALVTGEQRRSLLLEDLQELHRQRDPDYCREEQKLLDKEVSVFKYRERLGREERDYEKLAIERRRRTAMQPLSASSIGRESSRGVGYDEDRYGPRN